MNSTIEKIQKLLKLSKSCNQAEAELAFTKAKSIAMKYDLDLEMAAIQGIEIEKQPFDEREISSGTRLPVIHKYIVHIIQTHFKVSALSLKWKRQTKLTFFGRKNDIEVAREVYSRLLSTFDYLWKNYKKENSLNNDSKNSYFWGLYKGLDDKLTEEKEKSIIEKIYELPEPIQETSKEKLELALVNEEKELQNNLAKKYPKLANHSSRYGSINRRDVYSDGYSAGRNINTNNSPSLC